MSSIASWPKTRVATRRKPIPKRLVVRIYLPLPADFPIVGKARLCLPITGPTGYAMRGSLLRKCSSQRKARSVPSCQPLFSQRPIGGWRCAMPQTFAKVASYSMSTASARLSIPAARMRFRSPRSRNSTGRLSSIAGHHKAACSATASMKPICIGTNAISGGSCSNWLARRG